MLSGRNKSAPVAAYVIHQLPVFLAERRWQPVMGARLRVCPRLQRKTKKRMNRAKEERGESGRREGKDRVG